MTEKEYRSKEGTSRSELFTIINKTPLHFKYEQEHKKEDTASLAFGRAVHKLILEPETFDREFIVAPEVNRRTKEGKETWEAFLAEAGEREVVDAADFETIKEMKEALLENKMAAALLTGAHEKSFFWEDDETGVLLKCRPDCMTEYEGKKYLVDYKTTTSCADGAFERDARKYGYDFQSAFYREGVFNNTFEDYGFIFIVQEKTAPYAVRIYKCTDGFLDEGFEKFRTAVNLYRYCMDNDSWFGWEGADGSASTLTESARED